MMMNQYTELIPSLEYFAERKCTPTWNLKKTLLDFHDLTYVISGKSTYYINEIPFHLKQGDVIYIPKGCYRQAVTLQETPMHCYAFNFQCSVNGQECTELPLPSTFPIPNDPELMKLYAAFSKLWLEKSPGYVLKARGTLMLILHKLLFDHSSRTSPAADSRVQKINDYILAHYNEKIDLQQLAHMSGLHPVYLGSLFKKVNGCTLKEYITNLRVNSAENLLLTGGYSVSEVAGICGFTDIFYFSRTFKRIKGYPPSNARKED